MEIRPASKITTQKEMFEYESYLQTHPNHDHHGTNLWKWEDLVLPQDQLVSKPNQILEIVYSGIFSYFFVNFLEKVIQITRLLHEH